MKKNKEAEKEQNLTEYYYCFRDRYYSEPRMIICLLYDHCENAFARGIAIRSPLDKMSIDKGKDTAYSYAIEALISKDSGAIMRREVVKLVLDNLLEEAPFDLHSYYKPRLTKFEVNLINRSI